ncbi:MAG: hypothetical protein ABUS79_07935 [Pseudomonadota bacterium]
MLLVALGACAGAAPPFDELPLRDTLRAEPDVVATLPVDARARLGARFQSAAAGDTAADPVAMAASSASGLATEVDRARQARSADALVIGLVGGGAAQALPAGTQTAATSPLPALDGVMATSTADLEALALNGAAGASLRELVAAAHAQRLRRVIGWPVAAVAVGDTVYVNAAWLVALAPAASSTSGARDGGGCGDAGCDGGASDAGSRADPGWRRDAGSRPYSGDGGRSPPPPAYTPPVYTPPPYTPPASDPSAGNLNDAASAADGCATLADACASSDGSTEDDTCSGEDDSQRSDCSTPADDGSSSDCRTAPGRGRTSVPTMLWMFAPLAYLWNRRR